MEYMLSIPPRKLSGRDVVTLSWLSDYFGYRVVKANISMIDQAFCPIKLKY